MHKTDPDECLEDRIISAVVCVLGCACGDVIGWVIAGTIWGLFLLVRSFPNYAGVAAISCGALILAVVTWRALRPDTTAFDDPGDIHARGD